MAFWEVLHGDCLKRLDEIDAESVDFIFADPPYFLSSGGDTCHGGKRVSVDKGAWDKPKSFSSMHDFNVSWMRKCSESLSPGGTMMITGTFHNMPSIAFAAQWLGMATINSITWRKKNPPPNLACRGLTHSTETILWVKSSIRRTHFFDYQTSRAPTGRQMLDCWDDIGRVTKQEKIHGKHPTQKPVALISRCLSFAAPCGGLVLDPFNGHGSTGVATILAGAEMSYIGIELDPKMIEITKKRLADAEKEVWA